VWKQSDRSTFNFYDADAHDLNTARDATLEAPIKEQLVVQWGDAPFFEGSTHSRDVNRRKM